MDNRTLLPSEMMKTITFDEHYTRMERTFVIKHRWVWILNICVTLSCFLAFVLLDGKELVFCYYIPLDLCLNLAKSAFFWFYFYEDKRIKADKIALEKRLSKSSAVGVQEPLLDGDKDTSSDNTRAIEL